MLCRLAKDPGSVLDQAQFPSSQTGWEFDVFVQLHETRHCAFREQIHVPAAIDTLGRSAECAALLRSTADHDVCFGGDKGTGELAGYCNADYAGDLDTRRLTAGCVFTLNGGAIGWSGRWQQTVAASTAEAECMAAAAATKEALWLRTFFDNLRFMVNPVVIRVKPCNFCCFPFCQ